MATVSATFTFGLPEDTDSDYIYIYSATTEDGSYSEVTNVAYDYGEYTYEYDNTDDATWYKIRFYNSTDDEWGPYSDPVYGGDFDKAAPFLAVSTTTDGAHYATVKDVYSYATLTAEDISSSEVSKALKRARAVVDLRTAELDVDRLELWDTNIARKKYNATLRILKEAEINLALGNIYRTLADDLVMKMQRDEDQEEPSVSIGNTSLSDTGAFRISTLVPQLLDMADRFSLVGSALLSSIQPRSIRFTNYDVARRIPRFKYPWL
jgi:hypothetical protein